MRRRSLQVFAVIAVSGALVIGLASILQNRALQADSYPAFSSFRTLPEGASVLYEALGRNPGMTAQRNIEALGSVHYDNAAFLMLGISPASVAGNPQWFSDMEELAGKGNRVIIGLLPRRHRFIQADADQSSEALQHWSIRVAYGKDTDLRDEEEDKLLPGWPMYFRESKGWTVTRKDNDRAVVIERPQGKGALVLLANSYLLSNGAMVDDRQTAFLASLIGPVHQAVFDETHFGIEETGSIAGLARRYRLQGLILGLVVTASLFIWKSASGFPPAPAASRSAPSFLGEDSSAAFVNLLRRNIRQEDILSTCVEAWRKMYQRKAGDNAAMVVDLAEAGRKTPAQTYAEIQKLLSGAPKIGSRASAAAPLQSSSHLEGAVSNQS